MAPPTHTFETDSFYAQYGRYDDVELSPTRAGGGSHRHMYSSVHIRKVEAQRKNVIKQPSLIRASEPKMSKTKNAKTRAGGKAS